jgi:hypothetical protein
MSQALKTAVARQRMLLHGRLEGVMGRLAARCRDLWGDRTALEALLAEALPTLPSCRYLYLLDGAARQVMDENTGHRSRRGTLHRRLPGMRLLPWLIAGLSMASGTASAETLCQGYGPQTPRDISNRAGGNSRL